MPMLNDIINSLYKNLITGNAYLSIVEGLWITIKISILALFFGSLFGGLLCFFRLCKIRLLKLFSQIVISILRGSPVLLLLMILYFVVFSDVRINALIIAVIAFALNSGAHISEIFRAAFEAVDKKQVEAARMLGFTRTQAFFAVTVPQAGKVAKPVYQSAIINLIQWTSVVGYVAITDLTRSVNNIGARTGDPFFALFLGILIYLGLSYSVYALFSFDKWKFKHND